MDDTSENSLPRVYIPQEQEYSEDYLQRYTDEDIKAILGDPTLSMQLGRVLLNSSRNIRQQPTEATELQKLWMEMKKMENYEHLKQFVGELRFVREKLLTALDNFATNIENYTKILSVARLVCSAGDITLSVAGLLFKDSPHSVKVFTTAAALGFAGTLSTITEMYLLMEASDDIMQQIDKDEKFYNKVEKWFQQTKELERAMQRVFPFEKYREVLQDFSDMVDRENQGAALLVRFLRRVAETDVGQIRDMGFLRNILSVFSIADIADLCHVMIFHLNPVQVDVCKMMLQVVYKSVKHMFFLHIPSLSPSQQNIWSPPVWGRLTFNFVATLHAFKTLKRLEVSKLASEMRYVRKHLDDQLKKLVEITNYFELRRNEAIIRVPYCIEPERNEIIDRAHNHDESKRNAAINRVSNNFESERDGAINKLQDKHLLNK